MLSSFPWVWKFQITFAIFLSFPERIPMLHTQTVIHILQNQCSRHIVWILVPEMSLVFPHLSPQFLATKYLYTCNSQLSFWHYFLFMGTGGVRRVPLGKTAGENHWEPKEDQHSAAYSMALPEAASLQFEYDLSWDDEIKGTFLWIKHHILIGCWGCHTSKVSQ